MVIRPACGAGDWYPADADELITSIAELLLAQPVTDVLPYALIVPHTKLENSGSISAAAFRHLSKLSSVIDSVVVIGAAEDEAKGVVLPICEQFATPLGNVEVDRKLCQSLALLPFVNRCDRTHYYSNRIEIQLPFLQTCLTDFNILPVLVGDVRLDDLTLLFNSFPRTRNCLIVLSLDVQSDCNESRDPFERRIMQAFLEHCRHDGRKLRLATLNSELPECDVLNSFIAH